MLQLCLLVSGQRCVDDRPYLIGEVLLPSVCPCLIVLLLHRLLVGMLHLLLSDLLMSCRVRLPAMLLLLLRRLRSDVHACQRFIGVDHLQAVGDSAVSLAC